MTLCLFIVSFPILAQNNNSTVLIVGDSLSSGYKLADKKDWVHILDSKLINTNIVNASTSGATTKDGVSILKFQLGIKFKSHSKSNLNKNKPDIVVIALGGNDFLRGIPLIETKKNLNDMVTLVKKSGAKVVIFGIPFFPNYGADYLKRIQSMYQSVVKEHNAYYLSNFLQPVTGASKSKYVMEDGIHFNESAQTPIANYIYDYLRRFSLIK